MPESKQLPPQLIIPSETLNALQAVQSLIPRPEDAQATNALQSSLLATAAMKTLIDDGTFEAARKAHASISAQTRRYQAAAQKISASYQRAANSIKYLNLLDETNWPLQLVDSPQIIDAILDLPYMQPNEIADRIEAIAIEHLDTRWLEETQKRWESLPDLAAGERDILARSLAYHRRREYHASVAMLMSMTERLILLNPIRDANLSDKRLETFNWLAERFEITRMPEEGFRRNRKGERYTPKDHVLFFVLNTKKGLLFWRSAGTYITRVVLSNSNDAALAEKNPLRHKICHGIQTNYGTVVHSLKSILATDIILRLNRAAKPRSPN